LGGGTVERETFPSIRKPVLGDNSRDIRLSRVEGKLLMPFLRGGGRTQGKRGGRKKTTGTRGAENGSKPSGWERKGE